VTEEKIYQHTDPGTWVQSTAELTELYNSFLCYPKPGKGLAPITGKKSTGFSHLCWSAIVPSTFKMCSWLYPKVHSLQRSCGRSGRNKMTLFFWLPKGSSIRVFIHFLGSFMFS